MAAASDVKARRICASADLAESSSGVRFSVDRYGVDEPAFVVRFHGQAYAYLNRCAHVPVQMDWQEGEFFDHSGLYLICATHGALYDPISGRCLGGRCNGKGLLVLPVSESDGQIFLLEEGKQSAG